MQHILTYILVLIANNANVAFVNQSTNESLTFADQEFNFNQTLVNNDFFTPLFIETKDSDNDENNISNTVFIKLFNNEYNNPIHEKSTITSNINIVSHSKFLLPFILDIPPPKDKLRSFIN